MEKICDFGRYRNMIVPPWCVQVARYKRSLRRHLLLRGVKDPGWEDWSPLIVIGIFGYIGSIQMMDLEK